MNRTIIFLSNGFCMAKNKFIKKAKNAVDNDRGGNLIAGLIFAAIIILGVIAMKTDIMSVFTETASTFKAWIKTKTTEIMS
ncbi:MAG: hypothetical protein N4A54_03975 [Peptostreptococcaceae bacterium]|jgi:hypothetical protein|nr:hypothetical protein [Peptostreptococcaceae bacterium]